MNTRSKETFFLYLVQIANLVIPLAIFPHIAKSLGIYGFGKFGYIQAVIALGTFCVDFGYDYYGAHLISRFYSRRKARSIIYGNIQLVKIILVGFVLIFGGILLLYSGISRDETLAVSIGLPSVISSILIPIWLFQGMQRLSKVAVITVSIKLLFMVLTWLTVNGEDDLVWAVVLQAYSSIIAGGIITLFAYQHKMFDLKYVSFSKRRMLEFFRGAAHIFSGSVMTLGFTYGNPIIIKILVGDAAVGQYVAAEKIVSLLRQSFSPLVQGGFSYICKLYEMGGAKEEIRRIINTTVFIMCALVLIAFVGTVFLSDIVFPVILGNEYDIKYILLLMIISQMFVAISMIQVTFIVIPSGWQSILKKIYGIALFCHVFYVIPFVLAMDGKGMAISMIITEAVVVIATSIYMNKSKL